MTTQPAGAQWLRNANLEFALPPNKSVAQQPPRPFPRQTTHDLATASKSIDVEEPVFKKQKLGNVSVAVRSSSHQDTLEGPGGSTSARDTEINGVKDPPPKATGAGLQTRTDHDQPGGQGRCNIFPVRPPRLVNRHSRSAEPKPISAPRKDVQVKPYTAESPSSAPKYQGNSLGAADFFPWAGHHSEDILSELTTKQGYYDKAQVSQNETSTARPLVWSSLKHKSGLQILSSLFVSALDQRQVYGTITTNPTFKPPPRVTLTDTKREAWLRDLANPAIPLRRLSRTIPHGIRGKVLLDHCLAKQIPTTRAIWLAKCVGANEIRAFKRKGASGAFAIGGEMNWIKDWTTNVEQFLETIVATCGAAGWSANINYALRIATQLFSERLLDQEHYLDWLITTLRNSDADNMPIWLLMTQIYWMEILQHRQRGRRLAEAMLEQLYRAKEYEHEEIFAAALQPLCKLLKTVIVSTPACLLLPTSWTKYEAVLRGCLDEHDQTLQSGFRLLSRRNARLLTAWARQSQQVGRSSRQHIIKLLDSVAGGTKISGVVDTCLGITDNTNLLIGTCLEWASSLYRHGHSRIYIAARALRRWAKTGIDLHQPIFNFLATNPEAAETQTSSIYRIIAELIRSKHFSVGKYLQWLMARGTLTGRGKLSRDGPCDVRLLLELPLIGLPVHVLNLRQILVSSVGASIAEETRSIATLKIWISRRIPGLPWNPVVPSSHELLNLDISQVSQTVRSDIGRWLRETVAPRFQTCDKDELFQDNTAHDRRDGLPSPVVTMEQFSEIRKVLEALEDFSILADILKMFANSESDSILTAITDTVNYHFDIFEAIGAAGDLFNHLLQQYKSIRIRKVLEKPFVESLADLGGRLPGSMRDVRKLHQEISLIEKTLSAAACSPISDHMAEALQSAESTFADEIDQVLTSGNSMDKQILTQLFETIIKRMETSWIDSGPPPIDFAELLVRLRPFGSQTFEALIKNWLENCLRSTDRPSLSEILPPFVCTTSITLESILTRTVSLLRGNARSSAFASLALDALDLLTLTMMDPLTSTGHRRYRFRIEQQQAIRKSSCHIVALIHATIEACAVEGRTGTRARNTISMPAFTNLIQNIMLFGAQSVAGISRAFETGLSIVQVHRAIDRALYPSHPHDLALPGFRSEIAKIVRSITDFNVPLCQLKLRTIFGVAIGKSENAAGDLLATLLEAARIPDDANLDYWADLVFGLSGGQALQVREEAEAELLSLIARDSIPCLVERNRLTTSLTSVIEATAFSIADRGTSSLVTQIADRFAVLLSSAQLLESDHNTEELLANKFGKGPDSFYVSLNILLRLLLIHQSTFQQTRFPQHTLARLLIVLSLLLVHPALASHPLLSDYIFDVLAFLTDIVTDETRSRCVRTIRDQQRSKDPRLLFLFGFPDGIEDEWLQLASNSSSASDVKAFEVVGVSTSTTATIVTTTTTPRQQFPLRRWELMQDATPLVTENDTSLSLTLFEARKAIL